MPSPCAFGIFLNVTCVCVCVCVIACVFVCVQAGRQTGNRRTDPTTGTSKVLVPSRGPGARPGARERFSLFSHIYIYIRRTSWRTLTKHAKKQPRRTLSPAHVQKRGHRRHTVKAAGHIYIYIERERYIYVYMYLSIYTHIYVYLYRCVRILPMFRELWILTSGVMDSVRLLGWVYVIWRIPRDPRLTVT